MPPRPLVSFLLLFGVASVAAATANPQVAAADSKLQAVLSVLGVEDEPTLSAVRAEEPTSTSAHRQDPSDKPKTTRDETSQNVSTAQTRQETGSKPVVANHPPHNQPTPRHDASPKTPLAETMSSLAHSHATGQENAIVQRLHDKLVGQTTCVDPKMPLEDDDKLASGGGGGDKTCSDHTPASNRHDTPVTHTLDAASVVGIQMPLDHNTNQAHDDGLDAAEQWAADQMAKLFRCLRGVKMSYKAAVAWATSQVTQIVDGAWCKVEEVVENLQDSRIMRHGFYLAVGVIVVAIGPSQIFEDYERRLMVQWWSISLFLLMEMARSSGVWDVGVEYVIEFFGYPVLNWAVGVGMLCACIAEMLIAELSKLCFGRPMRILGGPCSLLAVEYAGLTLAVNMGQDQPWVYVLFASANYLLCRKAALDWLPRVLVESLPAFITSLSQGISQTYARIVDAVIARAITTPEDIAFYKTPEWRKLFAFWSICFAGSWFLLNQLPLMQEFMTSPDVVTFSQQSVLPMWSFHCSFFMTSIVSFYRCGGRGMYFVLPIEVAFVVGFCALCQFIMHSWFGCGFACLLALYVSLDVLAGLETYRCQLNTALLLATERAQEAARLEAERIAIELAQEAARRVAAREAAVAHARNAARVEADVAAGLPRVVSLEDFAAVN